MNRLILPYELIHRVLLLVYELIDVCKMMYELFSYYLSFLILLTFFQLVAVLTEPSEYCEIPE
jgi:hypothetical protein